MRLNNSKSDTNQKLRMTKKIQGLDIRKNFFLNPNSLIHFLGKKGSKMLQILLGVQIKSCEQVFDNPKISGD